MKLAKGGEALAISLNLEVALKESVNKRPHTSYSRCILQQFLTRPADTKFLSVQEPLHVL
jgi:hypothetical protein